MPRSFGANEKQNFYDLIPSGFQRTKRKPLGIIAVLQHLRCNFFLKNPQQCDTLIYGK